MTRLILKKNLVKLSTLTNINYLLPCSQHVQPCSEFPESDLLAGIVVGLD